MLTEKGRFRHGICVGEGQCWPWRLSSPGQSRLVRQSQSGLRPAGPPRRSHLPARPGHKTVSRTARIPLMTHNPPVSSSAAQLSGPTAQRLSSSIGQQLNGYTAAAEGAAGGDTAEGGGGGGRTRAEQRGAPCTVPGACLPSPPPLCVSAAGCTYGGRLYAPGESIKSAEPCLNCTCHPVSLSITCHLRVCPTYPVPPPAGCFLVTRNSHCCSELICGESPAPGTQRQVTGSGHQPRWQSQITAPS